MFVTTLKEITVAEIDTSALIGYLGAIATALTTGGFALRSYFKREKVANAVDASTVKSHQGNDTVVDIAEVARLSTRLSELESKVSHLTDKLAAVRLIALDCYQLANECDCNGVNKARLLEHLKQIIRDA